MERTVPRTDSDEIDLFIRTYYSLLRSSGEVSIESLVESHEGMDSLLHANAKSFAIDIPAIVYASLRLPPEIRNARLILLGQRSEVFERWGYPVAKWKETAARARRRRAYYDGDSTLALYIASRSDIDDIIPTLTAFQIEWNKLHQRLSSPQGKLFLSQLPNEKTLSEDELAALAGAIGVSLGEIENLYAAWGQGTVSMLQEIAATKKRISIRLLAGSLADYRKAIRHWWLHIDRSVPDVNFEGRRVYFISSNTHSIQNLCSGFALSRRSQLYDYITAAGHDDLLQEFNDIRAEAVPSSEENFLYYVLKKYLQDGSPQLTQERIQAETDQGITHVDSEHGFELAAQVIDLGRLNPVIIDPRIQVPGIEKLVDSDAIILNIDYPLGLAAYELLTRISENVGKIAGIYVMGKSATLNGRVGDVMIPTVIHDEHSLNTYLFNNCFTSNDVDPYLIYGTVLDNQKAVTVRGTFLQNAQYMGVFYREGYTDIEMEAGPYLSAAYEIFRPKRHPQNELVSLHPAAFDIGIIHYASDKPLSKGHNLGAGSLSYMGMDPTYAASVAILRRIFTCEIKHLQNA